MSSKKREVEVAKNTTIEVKTEKPCVQSKHSSKIVHISCDTANSDSIQGAATSISRHYEDKEGQPSKNLEKLDKNKKEKVIISSKSSPTYSDSNKSKREQSSRNKKPQSWFTRNVSLRQRSHSITVIEGYPHLNRPGSNDEYDIQPHKMDPVFKTESHNIPKAMSTCSDSSRSSARRRYSLASSGSRGSRGSRGSESSLTGLTEENHPRVVFIGDQFVGKTALINRYTKGTFVDQVETMVSPVVKHTKYVYYSSIGKDVQVQFWDVDGGETRTALDSCLRAHAVIVVYDITNRSSFQKGQYLLESINPRISAMLIANKIDLKGSRKVTYSEGRLLAKIHRVQYIETSCKLNYNVTESLQLLLATIPKEYMRKRTPKIQSRSLSENFMNIPQGTSCTMCNQPISRHQHEKDEIEI